MDEDDLVDDGGHRDSVIDDLIDAKLAVHLTKTKYDEKRVVLWVLLFTAPEWGEMTQDYAHTGLTMSAVTLGIAVAAALGLLLYRPR